MSTQPFDPHSVRAQFPALQRTLNGAPVSYLDGPGGTQSPQLVIDALSGYLAHGSANLADNFITGREALDVTQAAREAMRDLLNASSADEIVFGQNMTSLTFAISRALARTWQPGDEIILTGLDHDANVSPWLLAAEDAGVTVRWLDFRPNDCTHALDTLPDLLNDKTRLIAVTAASNAVGSISDLATVIRHAHAAGALVYVDAVHYAPHGLVDVQALDCDFLVSSAYKYFGPHTGILYGKYDLLDSLTAYKVRPAPSKPPGKWETGTQSFESIAGVTAAVDYIASLAADDDETTSRRDRVVAAFERIKAHEMDLSERFLRGAMTVPGLRVYGITDIEQLDQRTPTFAVSLAGWTPEEVAWRLGDRGIFVYHGDYYAVEVMERLGVADSGGLVRIGFVHYNTVDEVDGVIAALRDLAAERSGA